MKKIVLLPLLISLVICFILTGCGQSETTPSIPTTTAPTSTTPTSTTPATTTPAVTQPTTEKELKIGMILDLSGSHAIEIMDIQLLLAEMDNAKGGVKIGNDYYKIKIIPYTNDNDMNKGVAAMNRLVFEDGVKFVISHAMLPDFVCPIAEPEKVITFSNGAIWNTGLLEKWHYNFTLLGQGTHEVSVAAWLIDNYPEIKGPNGLVMALPDNAPGHQGAAIISMPYKSLGAKPQLVFFPADQRDLSSLGTKIATMNPAWYMGNVGKVEDVALATTAAYDAGYRGHNFTFVTSETELLAPIFKPEVLEGFVCGASAMEFEPAITEYAQAIKDARIAKVGKWDCLDYMSTPCYTALKVAMQKAGSIDVDAVAAALHQGGFEFLVPDGIGMMITRPDMRLDGACVDAVIDNVIKVIRNRKPEVLAKFSPEKSLEYVRRAYPPLAPGQTPSIVNPE